LGEHEKRSAPSSGPVAELERELHAAANGIGIEVHHGTVKLAGHIGSAAAKSNAERAVQRVRGVTAVILDIDGDRKLPAPTIF
jgi:osmotically-inducible protein OsmY